MILLTTAVIQEMPDDIQTILAFDYGTKKIGVAIGDTLIQVARPLCDLVVRDGIPDWAKILDLVKNYKPGLCVVGLPLNMDGSKQKITNKVIAFVEELKQQTSLDVQTIDERLTSVAAKEMIFSEKKYGKRNKLKQRGLVDAYAAKIKIIDARKRMLLSLWRA